MEFVTELTGEHCNIQEPIHHKKELNFTKYIFHTRQNDIHKIVPGGGGVGGGIRCICFGEHLLRIKMKLSWIIFGERVANFFWGDAPQCGLQEAPRRPFLLAGNDRECLCKLFSTTHLDQEEALKKQGEEDIGDYLPETREELWTTSRPSICCVSDILYV